MLCYICSALLNHSTMYHKSCYITFVNTLYPCTIVFHSIPICHGSFHSEKSPVTIHFDFREMGEGYFPIRRTCKYRLLECEAIWVCPYKRCAACKLPAVSYEDHHLGWVGQLWLSTGPPSKSIFGGDVDSRLSLDIYSMVGDEPIRFEIPAVWIKLQFLAWREEYLHGFLLFLWPHIHRERIKQFGGNGLVIWV